MPPKSIVWKFMSKLSKTEVQCNLCNKKFSHYSSSTTSNLLYHVRSCHSIQYALEADKNKRPGISNTEARNDFKPETGSGEITGAAPVIASHHQTCLCQRRRNQQLSRCCSEQSRTSPTPLGRNYLMA